MDRPTFGRRARLRARRKRIALRAWVATLIGATLGLPAPTGIDLLARLERTPRGVESSDATASLLRFRREAFAARPVRPPRPSAERRRETGRSEQAPVAEPTSVPSIIAEAASEFGVDPGFMLSLGRCESDLDPQAQSPYGYHGLFQFDVATWNAYGYGSIYDPVAQARTAARLVAAGQVERWPNCA